MWEVPSFGVGIYFQFECNNIKRKTTRSRCQTIQHPTIIRSKQNIFLPRFWAISVPYKGLGHSDFPELRPCRKQQHFGFFWIKYQKKKRQWFRTKIQRIPLLRNNLIIASVLTTKKVYAHCLLRNKHCMKIHSLNYIVILSCCYHKTDIVYSLPPENN